MADRVVVVPSLRFAHRIVRVHARLEVPATRGGEPAVTPAIRVLVADAAAAIDAALRAGASGYLLKDVDPARLPLALRGVLDEQKRGSGDSLRWGRSALRA